MTNRFMDSHKAGYVHNSYYVKRDKYNTILSYLISKKTKLEIMKSNLSIFNIFGQIKYVFKFIEFKIMGYITLTWYCDICDYVMYDILKNGIFEKFKYLHDSGMKIDVINALHQSSLYGRLNIYKYVHENMNGYIHSSHLDYACQNVDINMIKYLCENGAGQNDNYRNAMKNTFIFGNKNTIKYLCDRGAQIDITDTEVLGLVCSAGNMDILEYLVENGVDVRKNNDVALLYACSGKQKKVIMYLIENKCDINAYNGELLRYAAYNNDMDFVKYLCENGIDVNTSGEKTSALIYAMNNNNKQMVEYLLNNGADRYYDDRIRDPYLAYVIKIGEYRSLSRHVHHIPCTDKDIIKMVDATSVNIKKSQPD